MKRVKSFLVIGLICSFQLMAQTVDNGFYLLKMGQLKGAKAVFAKNIEQNPTDSRAFYGLGECLFKAGNIDSADICYKQSLLLNKKNGYSYIGLAKIAFQKKDNANALLQLEAARKAGKKDAFVFTEIANLYLNLNGYTNNSDASSALAQAKVLNPSCSDIYLLLGTIAIKNKNFNDAANQLESAIFFDSTQFEAYFGIAKIYESAQNSAQAVDYFNKLIHKTPECILAYRELGELYFRLGKYSEAKANYAKYIAKAEYTSDEKERYAYTLFFSQDFDGAKKIITELSHNDPNNYIMLRLLSYMHFEKKEYNQGVDMFSKFFSKTPENKILALDYEYYGKTLEKASADSLKANVDSLAAIQYQKAYAIDTTKAYLIDETAKAYTRAKDYANAVKMYTISFQRKDPNKLQASDYFQLGRANYMAGYSLQASNDSVLQKAYLIKADTLFGTVYSLNPASHLGLLWRARANSLMDPKTIQGLAKPYYDKSLEIFTANPEKFKKEIIEAYSYLGFYYLTKTDYPSSKTYFKKVLEIDPANATVLEVMAGFTNNGK
jgi:tetratricopeptide (TPR) repeat protein